MGIKKGSCLSIPVLAVISLMGFVYYTTVFVFLEQWLGLDSSSGILSALAFSFFGFMGLVSFSVSVLTDPGGVPSSFAPDSEDPQQNQGRQLRYCDKCCTYKPPRTHHCRVCKRCVLKMVMFTSFIIQKDEDVNIHSPKLFYYREAVRAMWFARKSGRNTAILMTLVHIKTLP